MAKRNEITVLKKGRSEFNLVGKAKVGDFTFKMDCQSANSDWIYNALNLGIECGQNGTIYAEAMGGYGSERENRVYAHGKKTDENGREIDDFTNKITIDWEDRQDEEILKEVGDLAFFVAGLEKDTEGKVVKRRFLSEYDFIQYIEETLQDGMVVNVKGSISYSVYNDNLQMKRKIKSIFLSQAEEKDYKATFTQTLLLEEGAVGKPDRETLLIPITAKVVESVKKYNDKKFEKSVAMPFTKVFNVKASKENLENIKRFLKHFAAKKKTVTKLTVEGIFTRESVATTEVTEKDIPEDIMELIEMGLMEKEEVLNKIAFKNGGGKAPELVLIQKPALKFIENDGQQIPQIDKEEKAYTEDDVDVNLIIEELATVIDEGLNEIIDEDKTINNTEESESDDEEEADDLDWLNEL